MVTNRADAIDSVESLSTFGVDSALGRVASFLLSAAGFVRIARSSRITNTPVGLSIFAV